MSTVSFRDLLAARGPEVEELVEKRFRELLDDLPLAAMRNDCNFSQAEIGAALGISQAAVSKLESRGDMLLSTFYKYVVALGGTPRVHALVGDHCYSLQPSSTSCKSFRLESDRTLAEVVSAFAEPRGYSEFSKHKLLDPWVQSSQGAVLNAVRMSEQARTEANDCNILPWAA